MKQAKVYVGTREAGTITEDDTGYSFAYLSSYLSQPDAEPVSLTMPLSDQAYHSPVLFPFFDGLIPEGWLLDIAEENWKISARDRFSLLIACCKDCIGNVSIIPIETTDNV